MKNKALTVSIVIPVYNEEHHLKACLESIAVQTVMPAEVIVVDNNSADATMTIATQFPFVTTLKEKKQGVVYARDKGFNAVKSPIIGRIDADTILRPDWVEHIQRFYQDPAHEKNAITGGCEFYNVRMPSFNYWISSQFIFRMNRVMLGHYILWGSNMALPTVLWKAVAADTCKQTDVHEDLDLAIHLHRLGYAITYDTTLRVGVKMRRLFNDFSQLWPSLLMWPQTLRHHGIWSWTFSWAGAAFLYAASIVPFSAEYIGRLFGGSKLN